MPVKYRKIKYFKSKQHKHITGHAVFGDEVKVENSKYKKLFRTLMPNDGKPESIRGLYQYIKAVDKILKISKLEKK
jgi:hypothetical protein